MRLPGFLSTAYQNTKLFSMEHGDQVTHYVGMGLLIGGAILLVKASTSNKLENIVEEYKKYEEIDNKALDAKEITPEQKSIAHKEHCKRAAIGIGKVYAGPVIIFVAGLVFDQVSYKWLQNEKGQYKAEAAAALAALATYRERVVNDQGKEKDIEYYTGIKNEEVEVTDPETNEVKNETVSKNVDDAVIHYVKIFDKRNPNWQRDDLSNMTFITSNLNWYNYALDRDEIVFVNDCLKGLAMDITKLGQRAGYRRRPGDKTIRTINWKIYKYYDEDNCVAYKIDFLCEPDITDALDFAV